MTGQDVARLRLHVSRPCEECDGDGVVASDEWRVYDEWRQRRDERAPDDPEFYFLDHLGLDAVPAMQSPCGPCDGAGVTDDVVMGAEVVAAVLEFLPVAVIPRAELEAVIDDVKGAIAGAAAQSRGLTKAPVGQEEHLRVVQSGAEALRSLTDLLVTRG